MPTGKPPPAQVNFSKVVAPRATSRKASEEKAPWLPAVKILLLGDTCVGKSSIMARYADNVFDYAIMSTSGVDFKVKNIVIDANEITLRIWDTAGQERFKSITRSYYRGAMGIIVVYDLCDRKSFDHVRHWMLNIKQYGQGTAEVFLVGNKLDLAPTGRAVSYEEGKQLADSMQAGFLEVSAKGVHEEPESVAADRVEAETAVPKEGLHINELFAQVAAQVYRDNELFRTQLPQPKTSVPTSTMHDHANMAQETDGCC